jgi:hypothetical protein
MIEIEVPEKVWEHDYIWYARMEDELPLCMNTKEAAEMYLDLRKRLEAAEKWALSNSVECARCGHLAVAHGALGCVRCDAKPECRLSEHAVRILGLRAALAGEETK